MGVSIASDTWPTELLALFHRRWGSDHESPEYCKKEWQRLERLVQVYVNGHPGVQFPPVTSVVDLCEHMDATGKLRKTGD